MYEKNLYETKMSLVMRTMAADLLNHETALERKHRELGELAKALREALNNPTGPLANLAVDAYDDWINQ